MQKKEPETTAQLSDDINARQLRMFDAELKCYPFLHDANCACKDGA